MFKVNKVLRKIGKSTTNNKKSKCFWDCSLPEQFCKDFENNTILIISGIYSEEESKQHTTFYGVLFFN